MSKASRRVTNTPETATTPDWAPPRVDSQGRELIGDYPASGPARALALVAAGLAEDPDGILRPEQIAAFRGVEDALDMLGETPASSAAGTAPSSEGEEQ